MFFVARQLHYFALICVFVLAHTARFGWSLFFPRLLITFIGTLKFRKLDLHFGQFLLDYGFLIFSSHFGMWEPGWKTWGCWCWKVKVYRLSIPKFRTIAFSKYFLKIILEWLTISKIWLQEGMTFQPSMLYS
jgi:hypothetical protein